MGQVHLVQNKEMRNARIENSAENQVEGLRPDVAVLIECVAVAEDVFAARPIRTNGDHLVTTARPAHILACFDQRHSCWLQMGVPKESVVCEPRTLATLVFCQEPFPDFF